ncbi:MAG: hypothetical protein Q7S22_02940 [Candidatus Micrarchaeota archaeon]|nr:hypothetical protein [Candidatus Micrarchaeota archaeon]
MRIFLLIMFILSFSILVSAEKTYDLRLIIHKNDTVEFVSIMSIDGTSDPFLDVNRSGYSFRILSKNGAVLESGGFNLGFVSHIDTIPSSNISSEEQFIERDKSKGHWYLPYFKDAKLIQLFHKDKKIWEYDVEYLNPQPKEPAPVSIQQHPPNPAVLLVGGFCLAGIVIAIILYFLLGKKAK